VMVLIVVDFGNIELTGSVRRERRGIPDLAAGHTVDGNYPPVPLGVPLVDARAGNITCLDDIEDARVIPYKSGGSSELAGGSAVPRNHGPVTQGVALLDPAIEPPVRDIEVAR